MFYHNQKAACYTTHFEQQLTHASLLKSHPYLINKHEHRFCPAPRLIVEQPHSTAQKETCPANVSLQARWIISWSAAAH